jgi:transcriptional regulator with XRE-family HTH domain
MSTSNALRKWRKRRGLTQAEAATLLGVSQPYLSLIEKGIRALTPEMRDRMKMTAPNVSAREDDLYREQLGSLGYPGYAHRAGRRKPSPEALLLSVLSAPDADPRVVEALPWLIKRYAAEMNVDRLVRQAKLRNLQNRLGFLLSLSGVTTDSVRSALKELEKARLFEQASMCWDSMPPVVRQWIYQNRTPLAEHWRVLTRLDTEDLRAA